ncbi:MAG: M20 family peptidase [Sarcina sp.]
MKQDAISYLSTKQEELFNLSKQIFNAAEDSYNEYKSSEYICNYLERYGFKIEKNFQEIDTAFKATIGNGHPIICLTCEYDAVENKGHLTGHNLLCQIQIGAGISLAHILPKMKTKGTIVILGCPGEYLGGSKETFLRQGVFDEIDAILSVQPNTINCEVKSSAAIIPIEISFKSAYKLSLSKDCEYNSLDASLMLCNILKILEKGFNCHNSHIDYVISENTKEPFVKANHSTIKLLIRSKDMCNAKIIEDKIKSISNYIGTLLCVDTKISLYQPPSHPLITNPTLSRMLTNNFKESGIIDIKENIILHDGISLGSISAKVPTVNHLISITNEDTPLKYGTIDFANATLSKNANEIAQKVTQAIFCTAIDILETPHLLTEAKLELANIKTDLY